MPRRSSKPFPVQGTRIDDGTGVEAGTIPHYMAEIVYNLMLKSCMNRGIAEFPTLEMIEKDGGFPPMLVLDLLAGGDGQGLAFSAMVTNREDKLHKIISVGTRSA